MEFKVGDKFSDIHHSLFEIVEVTPTWMVLLNVKTEAKLITTPKGMEKDLSIKVLTKESE